MKVVVSARARRDFAAQVRWLRSHSPQAGRRAAVAIVELIDLLGDFPELGRADADGHRDKQVRFGRDGFVVRYRVEQDRIVIARIFHGAQDR